MFLILRSITIKLVGLLFLLACIGYLWLGPLRLDRDRVRPSIKQHSPRNDDATQCGFAGNPDIYGIGIRIGFYAQLITVWLGTDLVRQNRAEITNIRQLFMTSMFIALIVMSAQQEAYAIEAFIVLQILCCYFLVGPNYDKARVNYLKTTEGFENEVYDQLLGPALVIYNAWFWWKDLNRLKPTPCGTYGLIFVYKFSLYGTVQTLFKVLSVLNVVLIARDIWFHYFGILTAIVCRKMLSRDVHVAIQADAIARSNALRFASVNNSSNGSTAVTTSTSPKSNPSVSSSKSPSNVRVSNTPVMPTTPITAVPSAVSATPVAPVAPTIPILSATTVAPVAPAASNPPVSIAGGKVQLEKILQADDFITETVARLQKDLKPITLQRFQILGMNFATVRLWSGIKLKYQQYKRRAYFLLRDPTKLCLLHVIILILRSEGHFHTMLDRTVATMTIVNNADFNSLDLQNTHIAAQIRATKARAANPASRATGAAMIGLTYCIGAVLALELVIVWNHIEGTQTLGTVGQLIAFIAGVGGLIQVLYSEITYVISHGEPSYKSRAREKRVVPAWAEAYFEWKESVKLLSRRP